MAYVTKSYNFNSKYLLMKAFTSILIEEKFVLQKFGDLTWEHPV